MSLNEKMTALADAVRSKADRSDTLTIDAMTEAVNGLVVGDPTMTPLTVTPAKEQQSFSSSDLGVNTYYSTVTVNAIPSNYITTNDATAVRGDILEGKTAYVNGAKVTGGMTNHGNVVAKFNNIRDTWSIAANGYFYDLKVILTKKELTITPSAKTQNFNVITDEESDVFYSKVTVEAIPSEYVKTDDATAEKFDIIEGKTAYVNGEKITGTIQTVTPSLADNVVTIPAGYNATQQTVTIPAAGAPSVTDNVVTVNKGYQAEQKQITVGTAKGAAAYTPGTSDQSISAGTYLTGEQTIKGDANLKAENIAEGVTLFGVEGSFTGGSDTSDATVTAADLLEGVTAYGAEGKVTGTISTVTPSLEGNVFTVPSGFIAEPQTLTAGTVKLAETYTPGTSDISIPANLFLAEAQTIKGDANLLSGNIAKGVTIFGVTGTLEEGTDVSDATVTAADLLEGVTAYGAEGKVTGEIQTVSPSVTDNIVTVPKGYIAEPQTLTVGSAREGGTFMPKTTSVEIPKGTYFTSSLMILGDGSLTPNNVKQGVTMFGVEGSYTSDATATAADIANGKTAYARGKLITGNAPQAGVFYKCTAVNGPEYSHRAIVRGGGDAPFGVYTFEGRVKNNAMVYEQVIPGNVGEFDTVWYIYYISSELDGDYWVLSDRLDVEYPFSAHYYSSTFEGTWSPGDYGNEIYPEVVKETVLINSDKPKTWHGRKVVDTGGGFIISQTAVGDLSYGADDKGFIPVVGKIYSSDARVQLRKVYWYRPQALVFYANFEEFNKSAERGEITFHNMYAEAFDGVVFGHNGYMVTDFNVSDLGDEFTIAVTVTPYSTSRFALLSSNYSDYIIGIDTNGGTWNMWVGTGVEHGWNILQADGGYNDDVSSDSGRSKYAVTANQVQTVVMRHQGSSWDLYVDGRYVLHKEREGSFSPLGFLQFNIWGTNGMIPGKMKYHEVRIYNRALDGLEIGDITYA